MIFDYIYKMRTYHEDSFFDQYIFYADPDDEWVPMEHWFSDLYMHQFSDIMLSHYAELRNIYHTLDYYETRLKMLDGSNPSFQEFIDSLNGKVGNPDDQITG